MIPYYGVSNVALVMLTEWVGNSRFNTYVLLERIDRLIYPPDSDPRDQLETLLTLVYSFCFQKKVHPEHTKLVEDSPWSPYDDSPELLGLGLGQLLDKLEFPVFPKEFMDLFRLPELLTIGEYLSALAMTRYIRGLLELEYSVFHKRPEFAELMLENLRMFGRACRDYQRGPMYSEKTPTALAMRGVIDRLYRESKETELLCQGVIPVDGEKLTDTFLSLGCFYLELMEITWHPSRLSWILEHDSEQRWAM